jgi:DNA-binding GntR family transcriptional regulator
VAYGHTVDDVTHELRRMIIMGRFTAGDHLRQDALATELGVTRVPIREAFKTLVAAGVLVHRRNQGHFVAERSTSELRQLYWLRGAMENEIIRTSVWPDSAGIQDFRVLNQQMRALSGVGAVDQILAANRDLHFRLFSLSPQTFIIKEVARLWDLVAQYHALYLHTPEAVDLVVAEHAEIIDAIADHDRPRYKRLLGEHRANGERTVVSVLRERNTAKTAVSLPG